MEGRYLLGLLPVDRVLSFLGRQTTTEFDPDEVRAHHEAALAKRLSRGVIERSAPVEPFPEAFREHAERVVARPLYQRLFSSSDATLGLVDLRSLFTIQPHVNFTYADRSISREPTVQEVMERCLPATPKSVEIWGGVTHQGDDLACTLCTTDLNFVVSEAKLDTDDGTRLIFTFNRVSVFCQAVEVNGSLYLKDGTHRAVGLLARGITKMPCVVIRNARESQVPDHLPPDVLFGPTRPLIADFLDPELYLAHEWAERVKIIRIRVDEFVAPNRVP